LSGEDTVLAWYGNKGVDFRAASTLLARGLWRWVNTITLAVDIILTARFTAIVKSIIAVPVIQALVEAGAALVLLAGTKVLERIVISGSAKGRGRLGTTHLSLVDANVVVSVISIPAVEALLARVAARNSDAVSVHLVRIGPRSCARNRNLGFRRNLGTAWAIVDTTVVPDGVVVPVSEALSVGVAAGDEGSVSEEFVRILAKLATRRRRNDRNSHWSERLSVTNRSQSNRNNSSRGSSSFDRGGAFNRNRGGSLWSHGVNRSSSSYSNGSGSLRSHGCNRSFSLYRNRSGSLRSHGCNRNSSLYRNRSGSLRSHGCNRSSSSLGPARKRKLGTSQEDRFVASNKYDHQADASIGSGWFGEGYGTCLHNSITDWQAGDRRIVVSFLAILARKDSNGIVGIRVAVLPVDRHNPIAVTCLEEVVVGVE
jgi:hypothetical protein